MIRGLIFALQFLTRLPIPFDIKLDRDVISKSTIFFPYVGIFISLIAFIIYWLFLKFDRFIAAFLSVFSIIFVTGGLHIDGLADTCDGFFSNRPKERILEIMKDSRIGTFGVLAIIFDIFLKYLLVLKLPTNMVLTAFMVSLGLGRLEMSLLFTFGRSAKNGGLGNLFTENNTQLYWLIAFFSFSILCYIMLGWYYFVVLGFVTFTAFLIMLVSYKKIG